VATPIGNLEDITLRAIRILKEADIIACEDTRQTQKIAPALRNPERDGQLSRTQRIDAIPPELAIELEQGAKIALVSDAGTPGISEPWASPGDSVLAAPYSCGTDSRPVGIGGGAGGLRACRRKSSCSSDSCRRGRARARKALDALKAESRDADFLRGAAPGRGNARRCHGNSWARARQ